MGLRADDPAGSEFAFLLRRFRVQAGLSQQSLAGRAQVSVQAVSALERGYRKAPYPQTLDRLADALGLSADARAALEEAAARARDPKPRHPGYGFAAHVHNLPRQLSSFLGGDDIVDEIVALVISSALVTIAGTGGAGKTRAAIEAGFRLVDRFAHGVWFVELGPLDDPALVENAVAAAVGLREPSQRPLLESLQTFLERKRLLLIFDNCEHVIGSVRRVAATLLRACPKLGILATSREPLGFPGERVYRIPPLAFPTDRTDRANDALPYGAVALFADRAFAADGRFALTDENAAEVAEICRRLDGLPLAIELAAARVTVLSPRQLAERLDHVFGVLAGGDRAGVPRQQTMRAVIDWSYGLLSSRARLLFDRLGIFAGGFTLDAAVSVCADEAVEPADVLDLVASLVDKSLVVADFARGDARYHFLESTRQYALERLDARGEREGLARRHATVYLEIAERLGRDRYSAAERAWFSEAESELDNFRAALGWSFGAHNDATIGQRLAGALARAWYLLSAVEGRRWVDTALASIDETTPDEVAAQLYVADAEIQGAFGGPRASLEAAERALAVLERVDDRLLSARAWQSAGAALAALGHAGRGEASLREAAGSARELGNRGLLAMVLADLATVRSRNGDTDGARNLYSEALQIYGSLGHERPAASIAAQLAELEFTAGDTPAALSRVEEAVRGHAAVRNRRLVTYDLCNMAAYLIALDRFEEARSQATEAVTLARDVEAPLLAVIAMQHVAAVLALRRTGDAAQTRRDAASAAHLLGFVEGRLDSFDVRREYTEQQEYERMLIALRAAIGERELERLMALGRAWSEDRAVAEALEAEP